MKLTESFTLPSGRILKNRVLMAPMTNSSSHPNGDVTEEELVYYSRRAKSGIGAIITACANVEPLGIGFPNAIAADTDERIPSLAKLASAIKDNGSVAILQIFHAGRMSNPDLLHGEQPVSASAVAAIRPDAVTPREMSGEEVDATIRAFGDATRRAIEAGFDGVEIHGANTYLIQQFFSPLQSSYRQVGWRCKGTDGIPTSRYRISETSGTRARKITFHYRLPTFSRRARRTRYYNGRYHKIGRSSCETKR